MRKVFGYMIVMSFLIVSCDSKKERHNEVRKEIKKDTLKPKFKKSGIGVSTSGKVGVEISDGLIMSPDGSIGITLYDF